MPMLKWCNLQTGDINGVAIGKCGGNRHCSVLLIRTLHPHICKLAVGDGTMHECSAPATPLACGCSQDCHTVCEVPGIARVNTHRRNTNKGLNVAKYRHEIAIDYMNAAFASEKAPIERIRILRFAMFLPSKHSP